MNMNMTSMKYSLSSRNRSRVVSVWLASFAGGLSCLLLACCCLAEDAAPKSLTAVAEAKLKTLDPFYKQHVIAGGLLIVGSEKVSPYALREVGYLAQKLFANRPDILRKLVEVKKMHIGVMACTEMQTELPECRGLGPWWDYRARGLGGSSTSCGEESVLRLKGDPWKGESIVIHEFSHGFQGVIASLDKGYRERFMEIYNNARKSRRFRGYAIGGGPGEFWAEGVQAWFNCNGTIRPESGGGQSSFEVIGPKGEHICHLTNRDQVKKYMPEYAKLLDESFGHNPWVYTPIEKRLHQPHLRGFDPAKAPVFRWPPEVVAKYKKLDRKMMQGRVRIALVDSQGKTVKQGSRRGKLELDREYVKGDRIVISGSDNMIVKIDEHYAETIIYAPKKRISFPIPLWPQGIYKDKLPHPPAAFQGARRVITARAATKQEIRAYRNLACNPMDPRDRRDEKKDPAGRAWPAAKQTEMYPHASSNSEWRLAAVFAARNAIDGFVEATGDHHSWPRQSWGPYLPKDTPGLALLVEFGRPVDIDKLVFVVRHNVKQNNHWKEATVEFSDGSKVKVELKYNGKRQEFPVKKRFVTSMKFTSLVSNTKGRYAGLVELEAWGKPVPGMTYSHGAGGRSDR